MFGFHDPTGFDHGLVATFDGIAVQVSEFARGGGGQHRPEAASAIHQDLGFSVGQQTFQITFKDAFAEMPGFNRMALVPFMIFAHVHQDAGRIASKFLAGFGNRDFLHETAFNFYQFEKAR